MFQIPLFKAKSLGFERDMVAFSVKYGNLLVFFCKAVVDTGCPFTIISEVSIRRTRIPYNAKPLKYNVQLGNINMELRELGICELNFRDEAGNIKTFEQEVYVGIPLIKGHISQELPSFIGKDFLNGHSLSIIKKTRPPHLKRGGLTQALVFRMLRNENSKIYNYILKDVVFISDINKKEGNNYLLADD